MALSESLSGSSGRKSPLTLREDLSKIYDSFFLESTVMAEYCQLLKHPVPGVYILPSSVSSLIWYGIICLRVGIYKGGIFKFRVSIPANYPDGGCPEFDFQAGVYHPQVDLGTGQLDTKKEFQRWRRDVNHIHHLLKYAKSIFNNVDVHDPCNGEAAKLFRTDLERYKQKVAESIEQCRVDTLSPDSSDPHSIKTAEWTVDVMKAARTEIFEPKFLHEDTVGRNAQTCGLSWVEPGTHEPFSKTISSWH